MSNMPTKIDPNQHFDIKSRSAKWTPTEAITIEKDPPSPKKKHSTLKIFTPERRRTTRRSTRITGRRLRDGRSAWLLGGITSRHVLGVASRAVMSKALTFCSPWAIGDRLTEDAKILFDRRTKKYHFTHSYEVHSIEDPDPGFKNNRVVATDPGVKAFQTWYSPTTGKYGELLRDTGPEIKQRCVELDAFQSRIDRRSCRKFIRESPGEPSRK
jgi:hypothetical protein